MCALVMNIQEYLHSIGCEVKFLEEKHFARVHNTLDNHMKMLAKKGIVQPKNQAQAISYEEVQQLGNSSEGVRSYKRTSSEQKVAVSQTLYRSQGVKKS